MGAWCPDEMVSAVETWITREKRKRRVNRSDFLVEAARELLVREGIPIGEVMRTGEQRAANNDSCSAKDALNDGPLAAPLPESQPASYKRRKKRKSK